MDKEAIKILYLHFVDTEDDLRKDEMKKYGIKIKNSDEWKKWISGLLNNDKIDESC
jgi:cytochrome oxidase Cu insertion factor (SCO1/SenC/PrrC family)